MLILGVETSCDETAIAVVQDGTDVLTNIIATTTQDSQALAGVIPEDAARKQLNAILPVLHQAHIDAASIDAIAVTKGPGLLGSLLIGTTTARLLSSLWKKPLIGVHHTLGHLSSPWLDSTEPPQFPLITLSASGGHTDLWYRTSHTSGKLIGSTRDDAAGEAFDKGASMLGLPYPGGPSISRSAELGTRDAYDFPLPLHAENTCDYSFSGLKTALKYTIADLPVPLDTVRNDLAASFQEAICIHLLAQCQKALQRYPATREVHLVGGVSANTRLRELFTQKLATTLRTPQTLRYCTDNAAMIASAGFFLVQENPEHACDSFATHASLPLTEVITT